MNRLYFFPLVLVSLGACITMEGVAHTRAANDLRCPEDKIVMTNIGGSSFRATGCGQEATYNCIQSSQNSLACVREEQRPTQTQLTSASGAR
jgi:hypothetical protein